jgi:hypothetical protein
VSAVRFSVHGEQTFWYRCELRVFVSPSRVRGSQTSFSTRSVPFDPLSEGFRLSRVVSIPSVPFATLLLRVSALSYPLTGFRPSLLRGIPCLTLPMFRPFFSAVLSITQTRFLHFRSYPSMPLPDTRFGVLHSRPPLIRARGGVKCDSIHLSGFSFPVVRKRRECGKDGVVPMPLWQRQNHCCRVPHHPPEEKDGVGVSGKDGVGSFLCALPSN